MTTFLLLVLIALACWSISLQRQLLARADTAGEKFAQLLQKAAVARDTVLDVVRKSGGGRESLRQRLQELGLLKTPLEP